ncbi:MAG: hypothetical protein LBL94_12545 [Prevotellaceae bacterium]|jgi:hypothetical protein|nr:hypothetical protein [Prevotellaceae bacterium]
MSSKTGNITYFSDHLDKQYGKRGSVSREQYEQGFEAFKLGVMLPVASPKRRAYARKVGGKMRHKQVLFSG